MCKQNKKERERENIKTSGSCYIMVNKSESENNLRFVKKKNNNNLRQKSEKKQSKE